MEKKYYNIIASLIEKNDKFIGCEPILDDIIKDVYEHSKIVLGSVSNEDVIMAYLNKVVATSLITVPKKLNFNIKNKHRVISNVQSITNINIQNPRKQTELLQEDIVLPAKEEQTTPLAELEIEDSEKDDEVVLNEVIQQKTEETFETISFEVEETPIQEPELSIENELEQFVEPEQDEETLGFEDGQIAEDLFEAEEESIEIDDSNNQEEPISDIILETIDTEESEPNNEITFELETEKVNEIEAIEDLPFETTEESTLEMQELPEEATSIDVVDKNLVDQMINGVPSKEENFETEPEKEIETFDSDSETSTLELSSAETAIAEEVVIPEKLDLSEDLLSYEDSDSSDHSEYLELLNEEVCTGLKEFSIKYPEKKHIEVCKLKYKENLSVGEIANTLNFTEEAVIEVLNDIIELVKD